MAGDCGDGCAQGCVSLHMEAYLLSSCGRACRVSGRVPVGVLNCNQFMQVLYSIRSRCGTVLSVPFTHPSLARAAPPSLTPFRCVTADGAAGRPTARGIREPGLQLPLTARQARAQASLRGPHPQPARRPPPVHWVRGVLALRGAVRRLGAPLQGQGQLPARELRRARARGDICDPAQA